MPVRCKIMFSVLARTVRIVLALFNAISNPSSIAFLDFVKSVKKLAVLESTTILPRWIRYHKQVSRVPKIQSLQKISFVPISAPHAIPYH